MQAGTPEALVIALTGWRRTVRQGALVLVALTAIGTALASLLALPDAPLGILVAPVAVALAINATSTLRRPFPRGRRTGVLSVVFGPVACVALLITLLQQPLHSDALPVALVGALAMVGLGLLLLVIETITHEAELARLRREAAPVFPTACVVRR